MRESYGDIHKLIDLGINKKNSFTTEQLLDKELKNINGENRLEVTNRMNKALEKILKDNNGKNIAIVSHGAAIKFLLLNWCMLDSNKDLVFNKNVIKVDSPIVIEIIFDGEKFIDLKQIF